MTASVAFWVMGGKKGMIAKLYVTCREEIIRLVIMRLLCLLYTIYLVTLV